MASGCGAVGRSTDGDVSHGKELFLDPKTQCAACHTFADAKSQGQIGPNLDHAFTSALSQGFDEQTIRDVVRGQIAYPEEPMPANLVEGQDADDLSAYIAKCAGKADCGVIASKSQADAGSTGAEGGSGTTATPQGDPKPDGKKVFASAGCNGCHTLSDADASGKIGPNLDELKPSQEQVAKKVANGGGGMPAFKGQLSDAEIAAVAEYVSGAAGK